MAIYKHQDNWIDTLQDPSSCRLKKPRVLGITMIMDKGLGLVQFKDFIQASGEHIDYIKLGFGSSALYPPFILEEKIRLAKEYNVSIYPGGTFFEVAYLQGKSDHYLDTLKRVGFDTVEISDGTISFTREERNQFIHKAKEMGFEVLTECGKKVEGSSVELLDLLTTLYYDLEYGAKYMIIEGRESGVNVGLFNNEGRIRGDLIQLVKDNLKEFHHQLIWEAPKTHQQITFIKHIGSNVNLGNVAPDDILSVEALRRGLRSDTVQIMDKEV